MARYTGPKNKLARKVGEDLGLKTNAVKLSKRLMVRPGQHGQRGRRKLSDYGLQLKEKQKLRYIYGILEKQLQKLFTQASKNPSSTGAALLTLLERRLDNVIYRLGWANTRSAARQLVNHGHFLVNGKKMSIPSYSVKPEDVISIRPKSTSVPMIAEGVKKETAVAWLEKKGPAAKVTRLPIRKEIAESVDEQLVVEFYSR